MTRESIEKLVLWLVLALLIQFVGSKGVYLYYSTNSGMSGDLNAEQVNQFAQAMQFQMLTETVLGLLGNIVIGVWLFINAEQRKYLWAALGVAALWWALPIYAYYVHTEKST